MTPHPGYEDPWAKYTKKEWEKIFTDERLPVLKLSQPSVGVAARQR